MGFFNDQAQARAAEAAAIEEFKRSGTLCNRNGGAPLPDRISLPMNEEQVKRLDEWRRRQEDLPTRSEAIRRLLDIALDQAEGKASTALGDERRP
jgi:hypothetical protein